MVAQADKRADGAADHELSEAPTSVADSRGRPQFGTYVGELAEVDLSSLRGKFGLSRRRRLLKQKRWQFSAVATPEVMVVLAVVDVGYAANSFTYAVDFVDGELLFDHSFMGLPGVQVQVGDRQGEGHDASFRTLGAQVSTKRGYGRAPYGMKIDIGRVRSPGHGPIRCRCDIYTDPAPPALTVIAPVPEGGIVNVTQKWAGLAAQGVLQVGGRVYSLDKGVAGLDYTQGYLARRTAWRWALAMGRLPDGRTLGINLVEGFNEDRDDVNENGLWVGERFIPLDRARFSFDKKDPMAPWHVRTLDGIIDLEFAPLHVHREDRNLKLITSYFVQPAGRFSGVIKLDGECFEVKDLPGMTEDQEVYW